MLILLHSDLGRRLRSPQSRARIPRQQGNEAAAARNNVPGARNARLRWDEVAVVVVLLGGIAVLLLAGRGARRAPRAVVAALAGGGVARARQSLDDLRNEPDLRRAIIAAYARMEHALAVGGMPRRPSEAPFEYVERALGELETSAESARRLTDLFEWAKFSHHEPGPEMRDEAIDALVAVRDELRRHPTRRPSHEERARPDRDERRRQRRRCSS